MIRINLLPWRDSRLKSMKRLFVFQLLFCLLFPCLAIAAYRFVEQDRLTAKRQLVGAFRQANQPVLKKIEMLESGAYRSENPKLKQQRLIHVINQKNKLPAILALLTKQKRTGQFKQLSIDHQALKITYVGADVNDSLALFQLLNSYSEFCDVSFAPTTSVSEPEEPASYPNTSAKPHHHGKINYEFNASLCDFSND